jgi:hypothetical protein
VDFCADAQPFVGLHTDALTSARRGHVVVLDLHRGDLLVEEHLAVSNEPHVVADGDITRQLDGRNADPVEEVKVGYEILKSLGLRHRGVNIISCPSCARQGFDVIKTVEALEERLEHIKTPMSLSIIGCVVNGPGEALMTDVGFTGGGAGSGMVYLAGKQSHKLSNDQMIDHIVEQVEKKAVELEAEALAQAAE